MGYPAGRTRKPPELTVVNGELFKVPPAPEDLDENEREAWNELRDAINPKRVMTAADVIAFKLLVQALVIARRAYDELAGGIVEHGEKMDRPSPAASVMASQQKLVWQGLARFGLTPADRSRVKADGGGGASVNPEDEFAAKPASGG